MYLPSVEDIVVLKPEKGTFNYAYGGRAGIIISKEKRFPEETRYLVKTGGGAIVRCFPNEMELVKRLPTIEVGDRVLASDGGFEFGEGIVVDKTDGGSVSTQYKVKFLLVNKDTLKVGETNTFGRLGLTLVEKAFDEDKKIMISLKDLVDTLTKEFKKKN